MRIRDRDPTLESSTVVEVSLHIPDNIQNHNKNETKINHLPGHLPGSAEPEQLRVGLGLSGPSPLGSPSSSVETLPIFF